MRLDTTPESVFARQTLRRGALCQGLRPEEVDQIAQAARWVSFRGGETIFRQDEHGDRLYVIAVGRVKLTLDAGSGHYRLQEYLGRGDHFGELAVLTDGHQTATASAVMDTDVLEFDRPSFERLLLAVPGLAANLSRSLGFRLREGRGRPRRRTAKVIGLVNSTLRTQGLLRPLAEALCEQGDTLEVLTDRPQPWTAADYRVESLPTGAPHEKATAIERRLAQIAERRDRVLLDVTQQSVDDGLPRLLASCEEVWWLIDTAYADAGRRNLERMLAAAPSLAPRTHVVWIMPLGEMLAPAWRGPRNHALARPDFKVPLGSASPHSGESGYDEANRRQRHGIDRLVRHLQGTRLGLALSGGGARGLAHLGVLKGLEDAGFSFDALAGTSSGALMGLSYAAGMAPAEAMTEFGRQLTAPRWLRMMPGGLHYYLWWMFRSGGWDRKLRPYLGAGTLEQLQTPLCTVAVDLVSGRQVIRDTGDAINAVLESINVPTLSRPILRDGMALVDGGVLNNLPADVLGERGVDLVVGVDVVSKLQARFAGNDPSTITERMHRPGAVESLLRVNEVHDHGRHSTRRNAVDLMISPETAPFEFADFGQVVPLAEVGEAAAVEAVPQLRQMLADLRRS